MCIIFGMIERNVACCHACLRPYGLVRTRAREREIGAPASLRSERKAAVRERSVRYWRTIPHQTTVLGTKRLPLSRSTSFSLSFSSLLIIFSLLIRVVLFRLRSLHPIFSFSPSSSSSSPEVGAHDGSATVTVVILPDSPPLTTTHISTKSFQRTPISARRGGTVARGKLQSSGIKGGSGGRGRGRGEKKRKVPKCSVDIREETRRDNLRPKKGKDRALSSLSEMIAGRGTTYTRGGASRTWLF